MQRRGDIYFSRDFPVLDVIAAWEEQGRVGRAIDSVEVAKLVGRPHGDVVQSIGRLFHAGLLDCVDASTFGGENYIVNRLSAAGLQESGLWPKPADLSTALNDVLQQEIQETSRSDPERSKKLRIILDTVGDLGTSFAAKLAAELMKNLGH